MKYMKRSNTYKANNVTFNPTTKQAHSYGWWKFVDVVEGKVIFSNYRYSTSTSKHQYKVRSLMNELGIKIDMELPLSMGVLKVSESRYRAGTEHVGMTLAEMIVTAEEYLCDKYSAEVIKRQEKNDKLRKKRLKAKLEDYLENALHFRDYDIHDENFFGRLNIVAVHQKVDADNLEGYVENAIEGFHRDGFGKVVFYV